MHCPFCCEIEDRISRSNELAIVILDAYPITTGHSLVIPKRHVADYFDLTADEHAAINTLLSDQKKQLQKQDATITGFNVGINIGEDAGQTVFHCHVHLIPRRKGDVPAPRGGVRGVIPGKQGY